MRIGITERGDAALDFSWYEKLKSGKYNGAILITKNVSPAFRDKVMDLHNAGHKLIVHATCTGWGSSAMEPKVPYYFEQLNRLNELINMGFPIEQCVLRIDPIMPTDSGLMAVNDVLNAAFQFGLLPKIRVRVSVLDEYKHVKERLLEMGYATFYGDKSFQAPPSEMWKTIEFLKTYSAAHNNIKFETCAETRLQDTNGVFEHNGCISAKDLQILGLSLVENMSINPQNRKGCSCLNCKTELLTNKHQCEHKCAYCYWKN